MMIVLACSGCGKRYEVDESLAGKKSRCKDCGNVFRIPAASAAPTGSDLNRRVSESPSTHDSDRVSRASEPCSSRRARRSHFAVNRSFGRCPRNDRSQLSALFQALRSRRGARRQEVAVQGLQGGLHHPVANGGACAAAGAGCAPKPSPLGLRHFTVIPEEVMPDAREEVELEPPRAVRQAPPRRIEEEETIDLAHGRAVNPKRPARASRRVEADTEVGVTVAGVYIALGVLAFIVLAIWHAAAESGSAQLGRVYGTSLLIFYVLGLLMASWANIWLLIIAFRDKIEQGLLCLLVPCYALYYICSRWRETRGIFAMSFAPPILVVLFALFGGYVLGVTGPSALVTGIKDRLEALDALTTSAPNLNKQAVAESVYRDYIQAMNRFAQELAKIEPTTVARMNLAEYQMSQLQAQHVENQFVVALNIAKTVNMDPVDLIAVKRAVGAEMRAAIIALKYQITRLASLPNARGRFDAIAADLDRNLTAWEASDDDSTNTQVADLFPRSKSNPNPAPGGIPPGTMPPGGPPPGFPHGGMRGGFETIEAHYERNAQPVR